MKPVSIFIIFCLIGSLLLFITHPLFPFNKENHQEDLVFIDKTNIQLEADLKKYIDDKFEKQFGVSNCIELRNKLKGDWWCDYPND